VPNAEVHLLTKKAHVNLIENNIYISKYFLLDKSISRILPDLQIEKYDFIIDLHNNLRSKRIILGLGIKSLTFNKLNIRKWLLVKLKLNFLPNEHLIDRYFHAIKKLGVANDGAGIDFFIPEKDKVATSTFPSSHQNGYVAFVIGANYSTKRLPIYKIVSLCKKINKPIILLGWKTEQMYGMQIMHEHPDLVYNGCGSYNINQSASIIEQASAVITHDTGLMHVAAAFNKKILSIWGNTVPAFGMTPYLDSPPYSIHEVQGLSCRPCSKIGFSKCPKGHFKCMNMIDEEEIVMVLEDWLKDNIPLQKQSF
jgi:ADP-heptose:LPS heptosyltransferase